MAVACSKRKVVHAVVHSDPLQPLLSAFAFAWKPTLLLAYYVQMARVPSPKTLHELMRRCPAAETPHFSPTLPPCESVGAVRIQVPVSERDAALLLVSW